MANVSHIFNVIVQGITLGPLSGVFEDKKKVSDSRMLNCATEAIRSHHF